MWRSYLEPGSQDSSDFGRSIDRVKLHRLHSARRGAGAPVIPTVISCWFSCWPLKVNILKSHQPRLLRLTSANQVQINIHWFCLAPSSVTTITCCGIIVHEFHTIIQHIPLALNVKIFYFSKSKKGGRVVGVARVAQKQLAIQKGSRQSGGQSCEKEIRTFGGETLSQTKER